MADVLVSGPNTFLDELIERLGAVNVMADARLSYPEVGLEEVIIRNSSGDLSLDRAAMDIVTMAAPFDEFPEFLRNEYEVLRFAYEGRFVDGYVSISGRTVKPL